MAQPGNCGSRALCILSFDGGSTRGLSSLIILQQIMWRVNSEVRGRAELDANTKMLEPWEVFDMICGTGTGGVIAILLGRLRMSVDKAILAYLHLSKQMYSGIKLWCERPFNAAAKVKREVSAIVTETSSSDRMLDTHDDADRCRVLVCAISTDDPLHPTRLRSYKRLDQAASDFTIWEAVRATSASHPETFPSGSMLKPNLGFNNPIEQLLDEAFECYEGDRGVACILSLGAGHATGLLPRTGFFPNLRYNKTAPLLKALVADCERTHSALHKRFDRGGISKVYFRFNLDTETLSGVGADEWKMPGAIVSYTEAYLRSIECNRKLDLLVKNIVARQGLVSIKQAGALA